MEEIEREMKDPAFWQKKERAVSLSKELDRIKNDLGDIELLRMELAEIKNDEEIISFENKLRKKEIQSFLSGKYDRNDAILSVFSGAGGQDAQDWAAILLRMYERYCQRKGLAVKIVHQSFGEGAGPEGRIGIKQAEMEIKGDFAYGFLKKEGGVHRLVRISPFSAKKLRHTSFALVEVIPEISKQDVDAEIKIRPEDLKLEFYKASGPGGQYVNKRETAARITHLPTKIVATCQSERSQAQNKEKAMEMLYSKLHLFYTQKREKEIEKIKGERVSASWGNQVRNYVLQPYKMVKDLKSGLETSKVDEVLDGDLEQFIEAEIVL